MIKFGYILSILIGISAAGSVFASNIEYTSGAIGDIAIQDSWNNTLFINGNGTPNAVYTYLPDTAANIPVRNINYSVQTTSTVCFALTSFSDASTIAQVGVPFVSIASTSVVTVKVFSNSGCSSGILETQFISPSLDLGISYDHNGAPVIHTLVANFSTAVPIGNTLGVQVQVSNGNPLYPAIYGAIGSGFDYFIPVYVFGILSPAGYCGGATCSLGDFGGCAKVSLCWAFTPDSTPDWGGLGTMIGSKPPFGYIGALTGGFSDINASGSPAFMLMSSTTRHNMGGILDPLRNGLVVLFWFGGAVWLYNRAKNIQP